MILRTLFININNNYLKLNTLRDKPINNSEWDYPLSNNTGRNCKILETKPIMTVMEWKDKKNL